MKQAVVYLWLSAPAVEEGAFFFLNRELERGGLFRTIVASDLRLLGYFIFKGGGGGYSWADTALAVELHRASRIRKLFNVPKDDAHHGVRNPLNKDCQESSQK